jgi:hypothetical protein
MFEGFLRRQLEEGSALARDSDLLHLIPRPEDPPQSYVARYCCTGLVRNDRNEVIEARDFAVGVWFPQDYLRRAEPFQVLTWLGPRNVFHPNISDRAPVICIGRLTPGTGLVDILYQVFEIITYNKLTMREDDALNPDACVWARGNQDRFPVDDRPLKRRALNLRVTTMERSG